MSGANRIIPKMQTVNANKRKQMWGDGDRDKGGVVRGRYPYAYIHTYIYLCIYFFLFTFFLFYTWTQMNQIGERKRSGETGGEIRKKGN